MSLKITIMGCGNSSGVPSAGNYWGACDPSEPRNIRSRCAVVVQSQTSNLIIDTGADFREQTNRFDIRQIHAVLYTHQHSDHCHGIDDLRSLFFRSGKQRINIYGKLSVMQELEERFPYLFRGGNSDEYYPPILRPHAFDAHQYGKPFHILPEISFVPFLMDHGTCQSVGYRFGDLSYCVDMKSLDNDALDVIRGSKIWIVDGAAYLNKNNTVHANLEELYEYNKYVKADEVYVTCLSTQMDYNTLAQELPPGFYPAYDGLSFNVG